MANKTRSPSTAGQGSGADHDWEETGNAATSDDSETYSETEPVDHETDLSSEKLILGGMDFGLPFNTTVQGVAVSIKANSHDDATMTVTLSNGTSASSEKTATIALANNTYVLGSATDTWGSYGDLKNLSEIWVVATATSDGYLSPYMRVFGADITVYYTIDQWCGWGPSEELTAIRYGTDEIIKAYYGTVVVYEKDG